MIITAVTSPSHRAVRTSKVSKEIAAASAPPIFVVPDIKATPHPVYGTIPIGRNGFTLAKQNLQMLDYWHQKASDICEAFEKSKSNQDEQWDAFEQVHAIQRDIYEAAKKAKVKTRHELAIQMRIISRHAISQGESELEGCLNVEEFNALTQRLYELTERIAPKKQPGPMTKGRALTRAGLLGRYQSFLTQELETVSWNLYGERDYAKQYTTYDSAVTKRCGSHHGKYKFFDERKLTTRAKAVLRSLKIDATVVDRDDMPASRTSKQ